MSIRYSRRSAITSWRARLAVAGHDAARLETLAVDRRGVVSVVVRSSILRTQLPKRVARLVRGDLEQIHGEKWTPIDGGRVRGEVAVSMRGAPLSGTCAALRAPAGNGSRWEVSGIVAVKLPLVGSPIENMIGTQPGTGITELQRFTAEWIEENR